MSRGHADNWSHPGHYLVDPYTWPWSTNGHGHGHEWPTATPLCNVNRPSHSEIKLFQNLTMKIHGQGHVCGQRSRSCLTFKIQKSKSWSRSNPLVAFEASGVQSICLFFVSWQSDHFWLRYRKFHIWTWKPQVKVMVKVKHDGHIWGIEFNQYLCFMFRGNRTIFGSDIGNSIFDLENSMSRSWSMSSRVVTFEP